MGIVMDSVLWMLSVLLAVVYTAAGSSKLVASPERLVAAGMGWVAGTPLPRVRLVGALEVAGALGVILPWATGILPWLTPLAAWGLAAIQLGAIATNVRHGERDKLWVNALLLAVAVVVALGRSVG
jgi:uncharacterized membrane protein YphA (DoxX/SURF4 family)